MILYNVDEGFKELKKDIDDLQKYVDNRINELKSQLDIKPIQQFQPLFLEKIYVKLIDKGYIQQSKYLRISIPSECQDWLKENKEDIYNKFSSFDCSRTYQINKYNVENFNLQEIFDILDVIVEHDKPIHEENIIKSKSNKETRDAVYALLKRIGIKSEYFAYPNKRAKNRQWVKYNWVSEISNQIPIYDENLLTKLVNTYKDIINEWYKKEIEYIKEEQKKLEEEKKQKEHNKVLALLLAKYDLDLDKDWEDLLELVISKNKYLNLGYYLERNRGDWSDGCYYAEIGLMNFTIENEVDKEIYNDIYQYIKDWEDYDDGRVFRDCKYNYNALYKIANEQNPELYKDYEIIRKIMEELGKL